MLNSADNQWTESAAETLGLGGGGGMGKRIREFDWSKTPLGPIAQWPQSLRTVVNILLSSRYAMWMAWGPDLTMLYNDAYRPTLGIKHPWALGMGAREVWHEIWPDIGPRIQTVLDTSQSTYDEALLLFLERSGFPEETYHTFSYSPLADDEGRICGMLCVVTEETERVIGERRLKTLRDVASKLAATKTVDEMLQAINEELHLNRKDLPFTLTYVYDEDGGARLAAYSGIDPSHPLAPARIQPGSDFPWPAHELLNRPEHSLIQDLSEQQRVAPLPSGAWNKPVEQAAIVPLKRQGPEQPAGFFVAGTNPYRRYRPSYSGFVELLAGQISSALGQRPGLRGGTAARRGACRAEPRQDDILLECKSRAPDPAYPDVESGGGTALRQSPAHFRGPGVAGIGAPQRSAPPEAGQLTSRILTNRGRPDSSQLRAHRLGPLHGGVGLHFSLRHGEGRPDSHRSTARPFHRRSMWIVTCGRKSY